jgi:hypothetical protein
MKKESISLALVLMATVPSILSAEVADSSSPKNEAGVQSFKVGDPNCNSPQGSTEAGTSWVGMPGPGATVATGQTTMPNLMIANPSTTNGMEQNNPEQKGGQWTGGMSNTPWMGMPGARGMVGQVQIDDKTATVTSPVDGNNNFNVRMTVQGRGNPYSRTWNMRMGRGMGPGMGSPGMMGYGPGMGGNGPNGSAGSGQNQSSNEENNASNMGYGMGMSGPGMMGNGPTRPGGMIGYGQNQYSNEGNSGSNVGSGSGMMPGMRMPGSGMGMAGPPRMSSPPIGYGPWGGMPTPNGMMIPQGNMAHPGALESRLEKIEQRLDELMQKLQNSPKD